MAARPRRGSGTRPMLVRLGALALAILAMYAAMLLSGHTTPKLGLDLQGGTTVTLTPKTLNGKKPAGGAINQAVDIIRQRVNGFGVSEADVKRAGDTIEISVPGKGRSVVDQVGQTAQLDFREVSTSQQVALPTAPTGSPTPPPFSAAPTAVPTTPGTSPSPATSAPAPKVSSSPTAPTTATTPVAPGSSAAHSERLPLGPGIQLDAYHAVASPSASSPASPSTAGSATSAAAASPAPAASAPAPAPAASAASAADTPPAAAIAAFTKLDCVRDTGPPAGTLDQPTQWLATCGQGEQAGFKYLLKPAKVIGTDVKSADATLSTSTSGTGGWEVNINFTGKGQGRWTNLTKATVGKNVGVVLDNKVVSAPTIENVIYGSAQITGSFSQTQANNLANVLKYGALPLSFDKSSAESISASLGRSSLHAGLLAGAIGLALVIVYSFLYYRALGFVVIASLVISGVMVFALVVLLGQAIGFTLSLAGIAGLIVSVGITADSFVVFFERLKDEVREGRTVRTGVERGWVRARRTILSADTVSFLAAACLYILSIGSVRGFAFTLGLSTLLDLATVFLFTRPIVTLLVRKPFFSTGRASGLMVRNAPPPSPVGARRVGARPTAGVARAVARPAPVARPSLRKEV